MPPGPDPSPERTAGSTASAAVIVEDHLERRIRKPADLLRLLIGGVGLALLAGAGLVAQATATGTETDIAAAGRHLPAALLSLARIAAELALLILPVALAVRQFVRGQPRRLGEAAGTSALTVAVVVAANALLQLPAAAHLHTALTVPRHGAADTVPLDGYLAAFAAYVTVIDLGGRPGWRYGVWLAGGIYAITNLVAVDTTALSLAISVLVGRTVGVGVRYAAGLPSKRPPCTVATASRWQFSIGTRKPRVPSTAFTGWRGWAGRYRVACRCRWSTRWNAEHCCPTRQQTPASGHHACAPPSGPAQTPPCSPTTTARVPRWRRAARSRATLSFAGSGRPCCGCTPTASRTGRSPPTASSLPTMAP